MEYEEERGMHLPRRGTGGRRAGSSDPEREGPPFEPTLSVGGATPAGRAAPRGAGNGVFAIGIGCPG